MCREWIPAYVGLRHFIFCYRFPGINYCLLQLGLGDKLSLFETVLNRWTLSFFSYLQGIAY